MNQRWLLVTADDFGIGPATSEGILDAAACGAITSTVLLVNSPHAEQAIQLWRQHGSQLELGWHPNLTLDAPVLPAGNVPSLVRPDGRFWPLRSFIVRWLAGRLREEEIELELSAQLRRFQELTGQMPAVVNTHQHVGVFTPVGRVLLYVLERNGCRPLVRRVRESLGMLFRVRGARFKRTVLSTLGRRLARVQHEWSFPGNDTLAGISDPKYVEKPEFFERWLKASRGNVVELMCHPGHWDDTLVGRDCRAGDGWQRRRVTELKLLKSPAFVEAVHAAGFALATPGQLLGNGHFHVDAA